MPSPPTSGGGCRIRIPPRCVSRRCGAEGVGELIDTLASRLALDIRRITLTFDPDEPADRERIARVYRHGRVLEHETRDGRISLVADVPRRLVSRLESR